MLLRNKSNDELVEVLALTDLFDPFCEQLVGRYQHGEEAQDPEKFDKSTLVFLSGESLPRCWIDAHYRDNELKR